MHEELSQVKAELVIAQKETSTLACKLEETTQKNLVLHQQLERSFAAQDKIQDLFNDLKLKLSALHKKLSDK